MNALTKPADIKVNFILTIARTGSTLLSTMLNEHPNVISTIEEPFAYSLYPKYKHIKKWTSKTIQNYCYDFYLFSEGKLEIQFGTKKDLETILETHKKNLTIDLAIRLTYLCFFPTKNKNNITTVVDKQLLFHSCLKEVSSFYPESKFIILHRDPRDNAFTKWRMYEKKKEVGMQNYYRIAYDWNYTYNKILSLKNKIGTNRFLDIKYEDLVTNPEIELQKICSFLAITYQPIMLEYDEKIKNEISELERKQGESSAKYYFSFHDGLAQKPKTNKIGYWKQHLKPEEANLIWTVCGELAEKIGYKQDKDFIKQTLTFANYITTLAFFGNRIKTKLYYASPFFIKHFIKKLKYRQKFKSHALAKKGTQSFYEKTYHNN
ncbi:MAG: sulfotransferase [Bacteroidia bacterium]